MSTSLSARLSHLQSHALAVAAPYGADVQAYADDTHLDGPRYYCLFHLPGLGIDWQDAGEAETTWGALDNLEAALLMARVRLERPAPAELSTELPAEFFSTPEPPARNFSEDSPMVQALIAAYQRADTAASLVFARQRAYGCPLPQAHNIAGIVFHAKFYTWLAS